MSQIALNIGEVSKQNECDTVLTLSHTDLSQTCQLSLLSVSVTVILQRSVFVFVLSKLNY